MKAIIPALLLVASVLFASEGTSVSEWSTEVAASKPYLLEVCFGESPSALQSPSESFLQSGRRVGIAVTETDAGSLSSSDAKMTYKIRKSDTAFSAQLHVITSDRTSVVNSSHTANTRISLTEGRWIQIGELKKSLNGAAPQFFYFFARVAKNN